MRVWTGTTQPCTRRKLLLELALTHLPLELRQPGGTRVIFLGLTISFLCVLIVYLEHYTVFYYNLVKDRNNELL
jgi:hypothetical protein